MKKILNLLVLALAGAALLLTSCKDDETTGFSLYGFNPNPGVRGEAVTFYGEGLGAVTSVVFAGGAEVADITRNGSSISVVIPMTAQPGVIELRLGGGSYVTKSVLTLEESLESGAELFTYTDFENKTNGVTMVGRKLYIATAKQTDYLSDIVRVEFEGEEAAVEYDADAIVAAGGEEAATDAELTALSAKVDFVRGAHLVIVTIPEGAKSGAVNLYNSSDDRFEAPAVEIAQSEAESIVPAADVIPGLTWLTVTGENFDLVTSVGFTGGLEVTLDEIDANEDPLLEIAADGKSLRVMTKLGMQDGPLSLKTKSGEVIATPGVVTVLPSNISAWTENDLYKAGKNMTLSCNDTQDAAIDYRILLQIEKVFFYKADGSSIETAFEASEKYGCFNIAVPAEAADGRIDIVTYAGKQATAVADLVLVKAAVTNCDTEVAGGETFTVTGTDLDLITTVRLGDAECTFTPGADNTTLEVATERTYRSGPVLLTQANGLEITAAENINILAVGNILVTSMPAQAVQGDEITIEGSNFNMVESIYLDAVKVTSYTSRGDSSLSFIIPADVPSGSYALTFNLTDGTTETSAQTITIARTQQVEKTVWKGTTVLTAGWGASLQIPGTSFADCTTETLFTLYFCDSNGGQLQFKSAADGWPELTSPHNSPWWNGIDIPDGDTNYAFKLSAEDLASVQQYGMIIGGQNVTLTSLTMLVEEIVAEGGDKSLWKGSHVIGTGWSWDERFEIAASAFADLPATFTLEISFTLGSADYWQLKLGSIDGDDLSSPIEKGDADTQYHTVGLAAGQTSYSIALSADDVALLKSNGLRLTGYAVTLTEVKIAGAGASQTVIWDTPTVLPSGWGGSVRMDRDNGFDISVFADCTTATVFTIYVADSAENPQMQIKDGSWGTLVSANDPTTGWDGIDLAADQQSYEFSLSEADLTTLKSGGMIIGGQNTTVTKVTLK